LQGGLNWATDIAASTARCWILAV